MSVFRDIEIEWQGETYTVTPTNRLLRKIEGEGVSIAAMFANFNAGKPRYSEFSFVAAELLRSAGWDGDEDDIYAEILAACASGNEAAFVEFATRIGEAVVPKGLEGKKPEGQSSE